MVKDCLPFAVNELIRPSLTDKRGEEQLKDWCLSRVPWGSKGAWKEKVWRESKRDFAHFFTLLKTIHPKYLDLWNGTYQNDWAPDRSVFTYDSTVHVLAELGRAVVHIREVDADSGHSAEGRRPAVFRFHHQVKLAAWFIVQGLRYRNTPFEEKWGVLDLIRKKRNTLVSSSTIMVISVTSSPAKTLRYSGICWLNACWKHPKVWLTLSVKTQLPTRHNTEEIESLFISATVSESLKQLEISGIIHPYGKRGRRKWPPEMSPQDSSRRPRQTGTEPRCINVILWPQPSSVSVCVCVLSHFCCVRFCTTLWTVTHQAPLSMRFSRKEYWSRLPFPPPGDLPHPGTESLSLYLLHSQTGSLPVAPPGKDQLVYTCELHLSLKLNYPLRCLTYSQCAYLKLLGHKEDKEN